ncbi:coiled-coil domain-containing protein 57 [Nyctibius grandis]
MVAVAAPPTATAARAAPQGGHVAPDGSRRALGPPPPVLTQPREAATRLAPAEPSSPAQGHGGRVRPAPRARGERGPSCRAGPRTGRQRERCGARIERRAGLGPARVECCPGCRGEQARSSGLSWPLSLSSRNSHIHHQHEEYVNLKHHMERKIQELEGELACQKQVEADIQKTDCRLHEVKTVHSALTVEREQNIQASFNHGILPEGEKQIFQYDDRSSLSKDVPTLEIKKLQEQNANLRAAIAQMRKEMESLDEQMLSSLPLTENRQLAEQDSLCTNKVSTGTTLSSIKVSSASLGCTVKPNTEKGPKPKVLEEKMVDFEQQLPGVGLQYGVSCTLQGMQNKLKEAARKISILKQEKQQLIEMGNRLRAELRMVLKEGLWHTVSSKRCTVCVASGSLVPRELVKRTQCQLSALKRLQHRLTTQELQYAKQRHLSRISSLIACPSLKEEAAPSSCEEETGLPSAEVQLDFSIENHGPKQRKADTSSEIVQSQTLRQSPSQVQQVQLSSSRGRNFCQGVWQTLEMGSSPSVLSPQKNADQVEFEVTHSTEHPEESQQNIKAKDKLEMPAADLTVRRTRLEVQQKLKSRNLSCTHPVKPKISSNMAKIRNYNIKD